MDIQALNQLIQRRNQLAQDLERLHGRREQAQKTLAEIEAETRARNIDPDRIDQTIQELWDKFQKMVPELEAKITRCADSLAQYTTTVNR